jgi:hypothetical protein
MVTKTKRRTSPATDTSGHARVEQWEPQPVKLLRRPSDGQPAHELVHGLSIVSLGTKPGATE